ncbi:RloB domain-containing protein [Streptomyces sp. DW26H14]|uniref:RloB domain-containing protein n=1 Tax=Streptomyces sp. DW26H14 TaxID=3435395 RepID=UPI00403DDAD8
MPLRRPRQYYEDESRDVVYVAAEGERTERDYVALLNRTYGRTGKFFLHFSSARNGLRPTEVVSLVVEASSAPEDEKWALFDRDAADSRDRDIPEAMREAARQGVQVALSHPSFELWLLLHFQQWTTPQDGRDALVLGKLRAHPDAKGFEEYDTSSGERGKGINTRREESLLGRERTAVRNARRLVGLCPHGGCSGRDLPAGPIPGPGAETYAQWTRRSGHAENCDPLKRDPSSDMWRLLARLGVGVEKETADGGG